MAPPLNLDHERNEYFEEKWDKIVAKMLRAQVCEDPNFGAELAKGLNFYFLAAMKFANELEHDFQLRHSHVIQQEVEADVKRDGETEVRGQAYRPTETKSFTTTTKRDSMNSNEVSDKYQDTTITKQHQQFKPVSTETFIPQSFTVTDETANYSIPANVTQQQKDDKKNTTAPPKTEKRFSLQFEPKKLSKTFKSSSVASTPTEIPTSDATIQFGIVPKTPMHEIEKTVVTVNKRDSSSDYSTKRIQETSVSVKPPKPVHVERRVITDKIVQPPKPVPIIIPEIKKPTPPISIPPKIQPPPKPKPTVHPHGATAICWDGTYSYSQSRRGTCSWHGGVKEWL